MPSASGRNPFRPRSRSRGRPTIDRLTNGNAGRRIQQTPAGRRERLARGELQRIVELVPERLPQLAAALPGPRDFWDQDVAEAFTALAARDLDAARKSAEQMSGPNRDQALAGVNAAWARRDWDAALKWARGLPDGIDRDEIMRAGLVSLAGVDPAAALDQIGIVPPGGKSIFHISTTGARVLQAAAKVDFEGALEWIVANPGRLGSRDLIALDMPVTHMLNADAAGFLTRYSESGSLGPLMPAIQSSLLNSASGQQAAIWEWTQTQPDSPEIETLRKRVLSAAGYKDPQLALQLAGELPATPKGREDARHVARSLWNGGQNLYRFDSWYEQASEEFRPYLASTAFQMLRPETLSNPQAWADRLEQVKGSAKRDATVSLANAWAKRTPEEAVNWVGALPDDATRQKALSSAASTWARQDAHGAAAWINTLPVGDERDLSTISLVNAVIERHPVSAWDWALSVNSDNVRSELAANVVRSVASMDTETARQWIVEGPFSPSQRTKLLVELSNSKSASESR